MLSWSRQERWDMRRRRELHEQVAARFSLPAAGERMCRVYGAVTARARHLRLFQ
jgi:hypothetical protein